MPGGFCMGNREQPIFRTPNRCPADSARETGSNPFSGLPTDARRILHGKPGAPHFQDSQQMPPEPYTLSPKPLNPEPGARLSTTGR
jgi:hypothetical protein